MPATIARPTTARGERLSELARLVKADVISGLRPGDSPHAAALIEAAEGLAKRWVDRRRDMLGIRDDHDFDDLLQSLRLETLACVGGYDEVHTYTTFLAGGRRRSRWYAAAQAWRAARLGVPLYLVRGCRADADRVHRAIAFALSTGSINGHCDPADPHDGPEHHPDRADAVAGLLDALADLPAFDRDLIGSRFLVEPRETFLEIAARWGRSVTSVQRSESRALRRLRLALRSRKEAI